MKKAHCFRIERETKELAVVNFLPRLFGDNFNGVRRQSSSAAAALPVAPPADPHGSRGQPLHGQVESGGQCGSQPL